MGETTPPSHGLEQITDRTTHDAAVDLAADTTAKPNPNPTPIVIYVTSSAQSASSTLTAQIAKLAASDEFVNGQVRFFQMEMTKDTTPMIKFGPQNCPLFIFMRGRYCETEYGRIGVDGVREKCRRMMEMGKSS